MIDAEVTRIINGSHDQVWELLTDLTTVNEWHPEVKSVDLLSSHKKGIGATRLCHFYDGTSVKETVSAVDDKFMVLDMSDYSVPMKDYFAEIAAKPLDSNKTESQLHLSLYGEVWPNRALTWRDLIEGEDEICYQDDACRDKRAR
jgi:uncharacterized protein YndB with AHSA1/START domain